MEIIGYLALIGIGIILAIGGGGGSIFSLPVLVYLFSLDVVTASSYSLFVVGTTSMVGAWMNSKSDWIDIRSGLIFSISSTLAIILMRQWILPSIPEEIICFEGLTLTKRSLVLGVFAILALISSGIILSNRVDYASAPQRTICLNVLLPVGFATGLLVGFVGIGGGFLILPSLITFARLPFKTAVGTTLLVIGCNSLVGFLADVFRYPINWTFLLCITGLAALGMLFGNRYSRSIPVHRLRTWFAWIIAIVATAILMYELFP